MLAPGDSAKVGLAGKTPVFQLESGSAHYTLKTLSSVTLMEANSEVTPKDLVGDLTVDCKKPAGFWTTGHIAAVAGGAAAAGLAVGVVEARAISKSK